MFNIYLSFSDSAKFADIARNFINGNGYGQLFTFWSQNIFSQLGHKIFPSPWIPPVMPLSIAGFFKIFGVSDFAVVATSFLYFLFSLLFLFLITKRVFKSTTSAVLSVFAVGLNPNILEYAYSGASESVFILEILVAFYLISLKKKWGNLLAVVVLILMYFTRMHSFIFIIGTYLFYLLINIQSCKKVLAYFLLTVFALVVFDRLVLLRLSGTYFIYSITAAGENAASKFLPGVAVSDFMRGVDVSSFSILVVFKKVFYNLYNFYKLLPQIASPYMWALFIIGLSKWGKDRVENSLKLSTLFLVVTTFFVTAITIPFFRYLHPVVPMVYIFAIGTLVWIVDSIVDFQWATISKQLKIKFLKKESLARYISSILVFFFVGGQALGAFFLDSRFKAGRTNKNKPPVYAQLSWKLKEETENEDIIITNLDAWGGWYGERRTVWFPLEPDQLIPLGGEENPFDAIYLTSYLMDDENYFMGDEWRQIFYEPENPMNELIANNYVLKEIIEIKAEDIYENQDARAVLLVRKEE